MRGRLFGIRAYPPSSNGTSFQHNKKRPYPTSRIIEERDGSCAFILLIDRPELNKFYLEFTRELCNQAISDPKSKLSCLRASSNIATEDNILSKFSKFLLRLVKYFVLISDEINNGNATKPISYLAFPHHGPFFL